MGTLLGASAMSLPWVGNDQSFNDSMGSGTQAVRQIPILGAFPNGKQISHFIGEHANCQYDPTSTAGKYAQGDHEWKKGPRLRATRVWRTSG